MLSNATERLHKLRASVVMCDFNKSSFCKALGTKSLLYGVEAKTGGKKLETVRTDHLSEELEESRDVGGHWRRM